MQRSSRHRYVERARKFRGKRAVSDVLATILILALTVTLFSSIFFFVSTFPKPATQPNSQFQGKLFYSFVSKGTKTWTNLSFLTLTHLAGPTLLNSNTQIYVVSQLHPANTTTVYTLTSGGLGLTWGTGQVWNVSLAPDHLTTPDNLTVTIVSSSNVVYQQRLPGSSPTTPPIFEQFGTVPANPSVATSFTIFVQISDPFLSSTSKRVYLNLTTPSMSCVGQNATGTKLQMTFSASSGLWSYPGCSVSVSGTYYVTVWVTDANPIQPLQNSVIFPIVVGSSGGGGGGGGGSQVQVAILTNTSAPVVGQHLSVIVMVTNSAGVSGSATVFFGALIGTGTFNRTTATGNVPAGGSTGFPTTYTPSSTGALLLNTTVTLLGNSASATLALTVFPRILLVSENVAGGTVPSKSNSSALLASELNSAGFPFTTVFVPCTTTSYAPSVVSQFAAGSVVIIDFGSNSSNSAACATGLAYNSTTQVAGQITSAFNNGSSFWVVGNRAFPSFSSGCGVATYQSYLKIFGLQTGSACVSAVAIASYASATFTASTTLLSAGVTNPISINGNVTGVATYGTYKTFSPSSSAPVGTAFLSVGGATVGCYHTGGSSRAAATGTEPSQLGTAPAGSSWGAAGAQVAYNVVNYLANLASSSAPSRSGADFGIAGAFLTGTNHVSPSSFVVNLRANDASNGILTVLLLVNGVPATYQGSFVSATAVESGNGANSWATLTWEAPAAGAYVFSFVLSASPADGFTQNNQYVYYLTNLAITFT